MTPWTQSQPGLRHAEARSGSALIFVLWTVILLSLLISSFVFEMHLEAQVVSQRRKQFKAEYLARSGMASARALLSGDFSFEGESCDGERPFDRAARRVELGLALQKYRESVEDGSFEISIVPENSRRNVNQLSEEEWMLLFEECNVPSEQWAELIDCFMDWTDEGDLHRLNGAESDDPWYEVRGYPVKNRPLDSVDELLLIKNFTETLVFGGQTEAGEPIIGLADKLTVFGGKRVHLNSASREVLLTLPDLDQDMVEDILALRKGLDGEENTEDDGFESLEEPGIESAALTLSGPYVSVTVSGIAEPARYTIHAVLRVSDGQPAVMQWREGPDSPDGPSEESDAVFSDEANAHLDRE
jgi:general secretion pathway protein K